MIMCINVVATNFALSPPLTSFAAQSQLQWLLMLSPYPLAVTIQLHILMECSGLYEKATIE